MGLVMHVTTNWGDPYNFFSNPANQASSNWWTSAQGVTEEYVDADLRAWAQANGNGDWASWETSGTPDVPLSEAQLNEGAKLYAWGHNTYGWPLQLSDSPTVPGFGWHGMGGQAWGGHFGCPGDLRKSQRPEILRRAAALLHPTVPAQPPKPEVDPMYIFNVGLGQYLALGGKVIHIATPADVKACLAAGAKLITLPPAVAAALIA